MLLLMEVNSFLACMQRKCHTDAGILHRAFAVMVFNKDNELLLTQRSNLKELWPGFWDGSVSSHVHRGESCEDSARQKLKDEIGVEVNAMEYLFKIRYQALCARMEMLVPRMKSVLSFESKELTGLFQTEKNLCPRIH